VQLVALGRSGRLRIDLTDDAATLVLTAVLAAFHARSPNVLVELVELSGPEVLSAMHANTVDPALARSRGTRTGSPLKSFGAKAGASSSRKSTHSAEKTRSRRLTLLARPSLFGTEGAPRPVTPACQGVGLASRCIPRCGPSDGHHVGAGRLCDRSCAVFVRIGRRSRCGHATSAPRSWLWGRCPQA
jgi:DNA-binding transcriptional LysR family regulator